jgi:Fic family protein
MGERNSHSVNEFRGRVLPEPGVPAGYSALLDALDLEVPLPPRLAAISSRHHPQSNDTWLLRPAKQRVPSSPGEQLEFALRYEGVQLSILKPVFESLPASELEAHIRAGPTGTYARRLWFLYEWLTGRTLDVPDPGKVRAVPAVDPRLQGAIENGAVSTRHRVIDNLPGTPAFCPLFRKTTQLTKRSEERWTERATSVLRRTHPDVVTRAAAFLLLSDSRSSFNIEGERPSRDRATRWANAIAEAGTRALSLAELERLQRIIIGDSRFVELGLRTEDGFVGDHDRRTHEPLPDHISARPRDLRALVEGILAYEQRATAGGMDPVCTAAVVAFGFVYVHPFEDGNGRIHRWLIHDVLGRSGFNPPGLVFPISAVILRHLGEYRRVLESYSRPLTSLIQWEPTESGNVRVLNETADLYRYFDATAHAEFLYDRVAETIEIDLPTEVTYLEQYDRFAEGVKERVEMPSARIELLHRFLRQNGGRLSARAREREFAALTNEEVAEFEALFARHAPPPEPAEG